MTNRSQVTAAHVSSLTLAMPSHTTQHEPTAGAQHNWSKCFPYSMKEVQAKKIVLLGLIFITISLYLYHQATQQQNHKTMINEPSRKEQVTSKNPLDMKESYIPTQASGFNQADTFEGNSTELTLSELSHISPADRPSVTTAVSHNKGCLPYFKTLHVQPVPEQECGHPYVLMNDGGRLGNKLCQYASLYLLRHLYGVRVALKGRMKSYLARILKNVSLPANESECFIKKTRRLGYDALYMKLYTAARQARDNATEKNLLTLPLLKESYYVYNNPAPRDLLLAHRDLVRSLIRFKDELVSQAIAHINSATARFNATYHQRDFHIVTVHVRRTDYTNYIKKNYDLTQLDNLYYKRAFDFYKKRLKRVLFLVLSDDPLWCKQNLQAQDIVVVASRSATIDMALMSLGDQHITSYGTYSLIGALLGRGHITHPISQKGKYNIVDCVRLPVFHYISRDKTYEVDNSHVTLI